MKKLRLRKEMARRLKVMFCFLIVGAILIQFSNSGYILAYAEDDIIATYQIGAEGDNIQAVLTKDGTLALEGTGDTKDYTPDSMPFTDNIERITNVEVEDGITGLGDYLFFGCKNLNDKLELPSTLTSIGDYVFSGYTKETAPAFTYITNDFKSADISVPVAVEEKTEENTAKDTVEVDSTEKDIEASDITSENGEQATEATDKDESKEVEKSNAETKEVKQNMEVKTITEQEIGTDIFYAGQTGGYKANAKNKTFRESAEAASYIIADRFVTVSLDGVITQHLPVIDGKLIIPDLPNFGIVSHEADDAYTTHTFTGWSIDEKTYQPKDKYEIRDSDDKITLTSNWNEQWSIDPQVKTEAKEDVTVYSVIDQSTQKEIEKAEGYALSVQWQMNSKDKEDDGSWEDIKDATSSTYERKVQTGDTSSFFRAKVTILKESKLRVTTEPKVLTTESVKGINSLTPITVTYSANGGSGAMNSETFGENEKFKPTENAFTAPTDKVFVGWKVTEISNVTASYPSKTKNLLVGEIIKPNTVEFSLTLTSSSVNGNIKLEAQWNSTTIVFVNQSKGIDTNDGSKDSPFKTLQKAFSTLPSSGSVETNIIELQSNYTSSDYYFENSKYRKSATIRGQGSTNTTITQNAFRLVGDAKFEYINISIPIKDPRIEQNANSVEFGIDSKIPIDVEYYMTFNESTDSVITNNYGVHGSIDDPILAIFNSDKLEIGRFGALGRSTTGIHVSSISNVVCTKFVMKKGYIRNLFAGGMSDRSEYSNFSMEMYGGYIEIFAGGNNVFSSISKVNINVNVKIYGGKIDLLNCGPYGRNDSRLANTIGNINLNIEGGDIGTLYGGGSTGSINGNVNINISGGEINEFYGGGYGYNPNVPDNMYYDQTAVINGDVHIVFMGGRIKTDLFAGGKGYVKSKGSGVINGNVNVSIGGSAIIEGNLYAGGGGLAEDTTAAMINGYSTIEINGGIIKGSVYGAGEFGSVQNYSTVNISSGIINGTVYGAGNNIGVPTSNLTIIGSPSIGGNIYGGSNASGTTTTSNVTIQSSITNNVYAGGKGSGTTVTNANLNIEDGANIKGNAFGGSEQGTVTNSVVNLKGGYAKNVFGGSDQASVTGSISITSSSGSKAGNIYAGCNASGSVKNPILSLSGAATNVFGGGNATGSSASDVDGKSRINILSDENNKITNVYGGSNSTGLISSSIVNIKGYVENVYGGGYGADTIAKTPTVNIETGANVTGNVFGGGNLGQVSDPTVNLNGGTVKNAFAGGDAVGATGTVKLNSNTGSTATNIYGGSNSSGTVNSPIITVKGTSENVYGGGYGADTITKTSTVNIETGANVTGNVFGGGNLGQVSDPTVNLNGGTVKSAFAGGNAVGVTGIVKLNSNTGSTATNIYGGSNSSGTVTNPVLEIHGKVTNVYGGGYEGGTNDGSTTGTIVDSPTINVKEGTITNVYGGGEKGPTVNTNTIKITGGDITNVFGGGKSAAADNAVISLNNSAKDASSVENIYGGSESTGLVKSSHIEVNGIVNSVFGGGKGSQTIVKETYIKTETNSKANYVYGGSEEGKVVDATIVVMGPVEESVYGGGYGKTSVVTGNTWVYVANDVKDSIYGGGNQGSVEGNTHVDVASGTIGSTGKEGNVFGGSNQAKVDGDTLVHIGSFVVTTPEGAVLPTTKKLSISGTVFGGGNTTLGGKDFDAGDPYVLGNASVHIGGTNYSELKIGKSIFGDGNKCVVNGDKIIEILDYKAVGSNANKSIQRATVLTITGSQIESIGETDSANLVQTTSYSLNRIDNLILKGGSTLKLQNGVNLVMGFESQNTDETHQTKAQANNDTIGNKIYIQQGQHVEFRVNEDVSRPGYGDVKGFTQLGRYYIDGNAINSSAEGVYIMGSYYTADTSNNNTSGFTVAESEKFDGQDEIKKGDVIEATTNSTSWRNWNLGSQTKASNKTLTISDNPGSGKTAQITETWAADGSIYRIDPSSLQISGNNNYTVVNPDNITSSSNENTIGLSIETGQTGWLEQIKAGYVDSELGKIVPYSTAKAEGDSLDMRSISNNQISPIINVKLYNADNITASDTNPLTVTFTIDRIAEQADGSEIKTGSISVTLSITKTTTTSYASTLIGQGKAYDRAIQEYNYDTTSGVGTSVSKSSSITAQFSEKTESAKTISSQEINFSAGKSGTALTLPAGTSIMMVDRSGVTPVYYHYEVASNTSAIQLTDFVKNGSSEKYKNPGSVTRSNFIFILDFEGAQSFSNSDICMTLKTAYSTGSPSEKKVRFAITGDKRTYEMSSGQDNSSSTSVPSYRMNGTFGLSLTTNVTNTSSAGADTTGSDKQMAAKVQLKLTNTSTGTVIPIPSGWQIQSNGTRYSTTGDSATILLANSLTAAQSDIYVIMSNMGDISAGNYKLEISLVAGAMANYPSETLSSNTVTYKFKLTDDRYSIKSNIQDESKQVIKKSSTDKSMKYDVIRVSNGSSSTTNITTRTTLWKKDESGSYQQVDLAGKVEKVDGGTFDETNNKVTMPWGTFKTIGFTLKSDIDAGTYQWRYEIIQAVDNIENILATEKNSFIITED